MQRVWRGERPQAGRFREFYQCDIDVIGVDHVPIHFDGELAAIMVDILRGLNIGPFQMQISNRKILMGLCEGLGITDTLPVTRAIDKIEKIGVDGTRKLLTEAHVPAQNIETLITFAQIKTENENFVEQVLALGVENATLAEGVAELASVMAQLTHIERGYVVADLSIVRGLDYYTGTVYETKLLENRDFGSICSGGRYDDLAGSYINKHLPGVGISIGLSRLFDYMRINGKLGDITRKCPTDVLVCVPSDEKRIEAATVANSLRHRGMNVELYHSAQKIKKQMEYAVRKGIPFVWFPPFDDNGNHEVKNMITGEQVHADPKSWTK